MVERKTKRRGDRTEVLLRRLRLKEGNEKYGMSAIPG